MRSFSGIANIASIWLSKISHILFSLAVVPLVLARYGVAMAGLWALLNQVGAAINLLDVGITNGVTRYLARNLWQQDGTVSTDADSYFSTNFFILAIIGAVIAVVPILFMAGMTLLHSQNILPNQAVAQPMLIVALLTGLSLPLRLGQSLFASQSQFYISKTIEALFIFFKLVLVYVGINLFHLDFSTLVVFVYMIPISIGGVTLLSGVYVCKHANLRYSLFSWKHAGEIKKFSTSSVFISLASFLIYQTPAFFICIHRGMDKVIEISYPVMIFLTASNLMAALQMTLTPKAAKYTLAKDWRVLSELMRLNIRRYYVISMIPLVIFYFLGELTLRKWLPTSTVSGALVHSIYLFTLVLLAGIVLQSFARMALSILIGAGDVTDAARLEFSVSGMGVLLYLCCALVPGSGHGLYILSMLLIIVIRSFIVYPLYLNRFYKVNVNDLARVFVTLPVKQVGGSVP